MPTLRTADGYAGATLLTRDVADGVEIVVVTWWRSLESIGGFADGDLESAVVAEEAEALLTASIGGSGTTTSCFATILRRSPANR